MDRMGEHGVVVYVLYFIGMFCLSLLMNTLFLKFSKTLGIRNNGETVIRWGSLSKPSFGGISFYLVFLISFITYFLLFDQNQNLENTRLFGLFIACSLAFLMGLADDAYNTRPLLKFMVQILCGIILILFNGDIHLFDTPSWNYLLTIFWVVAIMNSINMLDNMDAITTIVSMVIIFVVLFMIFFMMEFSNAHIIILTGVLASLAGFLFFNWHPSKLYMGDTGSQFLGVFLATIGIKYFWNAPDASGNLEVSRQFLIVILAFTIPVIDTTVVVINRLLKGHSPFIGGKDHTTHHLFFNGFSEKRIAISYGAISFFSLSLVAYILHYIVEWKFIHIALFGGYFLLMFILLFRVTRKNS